MPNCKFCGTPVNAANVFHSACWEKQVEKMAEEFCDNYCRFNRMGLSEVQLNEQHCDNCALIRVLNLGLGCEKMPITNGDRIRDMSDEELGDFLGEWADKHLAWMCDGYGEVLCWLHQPVEVKKED